MADVSSTSDRHPLTEKLRALMKAVDELAEKPGRLAVACLVVLLVFYTGLVPSVATALKHSVDNIGNDLRTHDNNVKLVVQTRTASEERLNTTLLELVREMRERNRRDKIRECAEIRDRDLRAKCLE